jgi:HEAT repeat protein
MLAALGTGADAVPCLMKGLTNRFPDVRNEAANYLTGEWSAQFPEKRQQAIPFIMRLLNDPDESVRQNTTNQLKELDPQAASTAGVR